jgi:hypothetical protein
MSTSSEGTVIDAVSAQALLEPLTDLVARRSPRKTSRTVPR